MNGWALPLLLAVGALVAHPLDTYAATPTTVTCGQVLTTSTVVGNDLYDCPSHGLVVAADNIVINLNGHTIDGVKATDSAGVYVDGWQGVTVRNGQIKQFFYGLWMRSGSPGVSGNKAKLLKIIDTFATGLYLQNQISALVQSNVVSTTDTAITCDACPAAKIDSNQVFGGVNGIAATGGGMRISNNLAYGNQYGLNLDFSGIPGRVIGNKVVGSTYAGILVQTAATITRNTVTFSKGDGIQISVGIATLSGNGTFGNATYGINAVDGAIDRGKNRATGNNSGGAQCLNVACSP